MRELLLRLSQVASSFLGVLYKTGFLKRPNGKSCSECPLRALTSESSSLKGCSFSVISLDP